jgi:hypothetical protein
VVSGSDTANDSANLGIAIAIIDSLLVNPLGTVTLFGKKT